MSSTLYPLSLDPQRDTNFKGVWFYPMYDSLFSVTAVRTRYWDALGRPINHNPAILLRTQDLPPKKRFDVVASNPPTHSGP